MAWFPALDRLFAPAPESLSGESRTDWRAARGFQFRNRLLEFSVLTQQSAEVMVRVGRLQAETGRRTQGDESFSLLTKVFLRQAQVEVGEPVIGLEFGCPSGSDHCPWHPIPLGDFLSPTALRLIIRAGSVSPVRRWVASNDHSLLGPAEVGPHVS